MILPRNHDFELEFASKHHAVFVVMTLHAESGSTSIHMLGVSSLADVEASVQARCPGSHGHRGVLSCIGAVFGPVSRQYRVDKSWLPLVRKPQGMHRNEQALGKAVAGKYHAGYEARPGTYRTLLGLQIANTEVSHSRRRATRTDHTMAILAKSCRT